MMSTPESTTAVDRAFQLASSVILKPFGHQVNSTSIRLVAPSHTIGGRAFAVNEIWQHHHMQACDITRTAILQVYNRWA